MRVGWGFVSAFFQAIGLAYAVASGLGVTIPDVARMVGIDLTAPGKVLVGTAMFAVASLVDRFRLSVQLNQRGRRQRALEQIAKMRSVGVDLRTHGLTGLKDASEVAPWVAQYEDWFEKSVDAVYALAPHEAEAYRKLDLHTPFVFPEGIYYGTEHITKVSHFSDRLTRLEEIRKRYSIVST